MITDIREPDLSRWLHNNLPEEGQVVHVVKLSGGQSNPTYRLTTAHRDLVLRRKPFGALLASAHAIDREFRAITALHPIGFPVPKPVALCEDREVLGSEFYLMEAVDGESYFNGALPAHQPAERRGIYETAVATLAQLHSISPKAVGLDDYRRSGNYLARQIDRWTRQYRAAQTTHIEEVERLIAWLPRHVPDQERTTIVHGDFRIDNLLFARRSTCALALIDWELSTLGDPLADLSYFAMAWLMPSHWHPSGLRGAIFDSSGIPTLEDILGIYCELTRRPEVPDLRWHYAFNMFRMVGILQGIRRRSLDGSASSDNAAAATTHLEPLAAAAWQQAISLGAA